MRERRRLFNLVKGEPRFEVRAQAGANRMYLYDEIGYFGIMASDFVNEAMAFDGQDFELHVNSPGGDVFEGLAILNLIRTYSGKITGVVDGVAASAASFILMGCDEVHMSNNSEIMIHDAWGMCMGNAADMLDMAGRLDKVSDNIADVYARKAGGTVDEWRKRMKAEGWYGPSEAVDLGLANRIVGGESPDNAYDLTRFKNRKTESVVTVDPELPIDIAALIREAFEEASA